MLRIGDRRLREKKKKKKKKTQLNESGKAETRSGKKSFQQTQHARLITLTNPRLISVEYLIALGSHKEVRGVWRRGGGGQWGWGGGGGGGALISASEAPRRGYVLTGNRRSRLLTEKLGGRFFFLRFIFRSFPYYAIMSHLPVCKVAAKRMSAVTA